MGKVLLFLQCRFENRFDFVGEYPAFVYFFVADIKRGNIIIIVSVGYVGMFGLVDTFDDDVFVFRSFFEFVDVLESPFTKRTSGLVE